MILLVTFVDWVKKICDTRRRIETRKWTDRPACLNSDIDYSNSISITKLQFENKNDIQSLIQNLYITLILIKFQSSEFSNSLFLTETRNF